MTSQSIENQLEAPGAGLPPGEAFISKHLVLPLLGLTMTRKRAVSVFLAEGHRALELARSIDKSDIARRVLIDRFLGIEDSSRFWSAAMALDHLIIVGKGIAMTIQQLSAGEVPSRPAKIQDVKPNPETGAEILDTFESWLGEYAETGWLELPYPQHPRFEHPWFGPMNAAQWLKLNALHNGIHRKQIEKIIEGLASSGRIT